MPRDNSKLSMSQKQKVDKIRSDYQEIVEECEELTDWIRVLKKISEKRFCSKHHQHRCEQECLELLDSMIAYERHIASTREEKQEKMETFVSNLAIFHPDVDFTVAAYRKACEMDKLLQKKKELIVDNLDSSRKKATLQERFGDRRKREE